jgi:5-methylcytosine-specific restriction endonuclease McrA
VKLEFCVACGSKDDLQHGHLVTNAQGGSDAEPNRITLCTSCHDKLHQRHLLLGGRAVPASADRRH